MNLIDIANARLASQQITTTKFKTAKDVVGWMGAMQAQDFSMVKWAVGVRLPNSTDQAIESAINHGEIVRTHLLRPTWHLVSSNDIHWILELTAPQIKPLLISRHKELELSERLLAKSAAIMKKLLGGGKHLSREELISAFKKEKISTDENRASHIFIHAELNGLICNGMIKDGKQTYALLKERFPQTESLHRHEALARLAKTYFTSHCPATLQDFIWWSGLSIRDAKQALEMVKTNFVPEIINAQTYWLTSSFSFPKRIKKSAYLLPAFDEFTISYKDRSAALPFKNHNKAISSNGVFWPIIVANGQVAGVWKRTVKKEKVLIETNFFNQPDKTIKELIKKAAVQFGAFLRKEVEIKDVP